MTRQEKRGLADLRAMKRHQRVNEIVATRKKNIKRRSDGEEPEAHTLVIGNGPGMCLVSSGGGQRWVRTEMVAVPGDRVAIRHEKVAAVAKRNTTLGRADPSHPRGELLIAANVDVLVIVASIVDPPFRPGLVDRYVIAAARGGIQPVLCVTKTDLCADTRIADVYRQRGIPVVGCSVASGAGIEELRGLLAGCLAAFAGHSGVGKSSLLNALAGEESAPTGAVAEATGKGRHTTTASRLFELKNGARIIDTPGIRMLGLGRVSPEEIRAAFPEFAEYPCRFRDCLHVAEPECGVRAAVEAGEIGQARYASYIKVTGEE